MSQRLVVLCSGYLLFAIAAATGAQADELPLRKAGLWELTELTEAPPRTLQQCIDETVEKEMMSVTVAPGGEPMCSKYDVRKSATGYVVDSVCTVLTTVTTRTEITGDFNSAYTMKNTRHAEGLMLGKGGVDRTSTFEARWLGACKADQKPGDIVMPDGLKMNVKDMAKLKEPAGEDNDDLKGLLSKLKGLPSK